MTPRVGTVRCKVWSLRYGVKCNSANSTGLMCYDLLRTPYAVMQSVFTRSHELQTEMTAYIR